MATTTEPRYVAGQRQRKAAVLFQACVALGYDAQRAVRLEPEHWRSVAKYAGVRKPSPATVRMVCGMLAGTVVLLCETCGRGNPDGQVGPPLPWGHPGPCRR